jgi:hypothetical protein
VLSVTSSTAPQFGGQGSTAAHQPAPRDSSAVDISKRNSSTRGEIITRHSLTRSRSRAKRRFSGSTATSSHSPSSERGLHWSREKDECTCYTAPVHSLTAEADLLPVAKPAPLGVIGVCALDAKSRSKPSRNILNRLVSKGFQVVVFGDKVIFDEGV